MAATARLVAAACLAAALIGGCGQSAPKQAGSKLAAIGGSPPTRLSGSPTRPHGSPTRPRGSDTTTTAAASGSTTGGGAPVGSTTSTSGGAPVGSTTATGATRPTQLQRSLASALAQAGSQDGLVVDDLGSGRTLYAVRAGVARPPASVEKLYTTVAALNLLKPSTRLQTTVLGQGTLLHGGVWKGNLYLHGGGDPTFGDGSWNQAYEGGYGPTALQIAEQLRHDGIRRVTGHIFADASLFDDDRGGPATDNRPDTPDYGGEMSALVYDHGMSSGRMSPPVFAAHELALTLRGQGMRVGAAGRTRDAPAGAAVLAAVQSPPIATLVRLMDVPSDDLIADMLAKQLGARLLGQGTLLAGATEIQEAIVSAYGLHPTILDGSGLDRDDRTSPAQVVGLLRKVWNTPTGALLYAALPVVGEQGTVQSLGLHSPAAGHCVAKTGTLDNVTNLAGYCHARGHRTLAFALMIDGPANYVATPILSRVVAAIARY